MTIAQGVTALLLAGLALAHSLAGETGFIRPLLAADWTIEEVPRWAANRLLRVAWHLTSVAWLAFAVIAIGGTPVAAVAVASLVSGLMMFIGLRGHPAWPPFLLAGLFGLHYEGLLADPVLVAGAATAVAIAGAAGVVHLYWAAGGKAMLEGAVPTTPDGDQTFTPGPLATAAVAALLFGFAGLVVATAAFDEPWFVRWALLAGVAVLAVRAVGDGRHAGFTKKERTTRFGQLDDQVFTPVVTILAITASAALLM